MTTLPRAEQSTKLFVRGALVRRILPFADHCHERRDGQEQSELNP
jgi:hypothetical protein